MRFRRRMRLHVVELTPPPDEGVRVIRDDESAFNAAGAVARIERFVGAANASIQQIEDRLLHLEAVTSDLVDDLQGRPVHGDLLEVRLQGARIDAELNRLATELRGEIAEIKDEADGQIEGRPSREKRLAALAEEMLDLTKHGEAS